MTTPARGGKESEAGIKRVKDMIEGCGSDPEGWLGKGIAEFEGKDIRVFSIKSNKKRPRGRSGTTIKENVAALRSEGFKLCMNKKRRPEGKVGLDGTVNPARR